MSLKSITPSTKNNFPLKIIVIAGPTGTGKTIVADEICRLIGGGEIISADSRQIYKYLVTGTNLTPTQSPQHLVSFLEPDKQYSAQQFAADATNIINNLTASDDKFPVVVGGTGLYLKALFEGGLIPLPEGNPEIRKRLNQLPTEELYRRLVYVDEKYANKNRLNPQRLKRALEIYEITGKPMSAHIEEHQEEKNKKIPSEREKYILFGLFSSDKNFYKKIISARTDEMIKNSSEKESIIDEALRVTATLGYRRDAPAFSGIGYKSVFDYIDGKITLETLKEKIIHQTLQYAKRQMTWFRHQTTPEVWIDITEYQPFDSVKIAQRIIEIWKNKKE